MPPAVTAGDTTVTILGPTATIAGGANGFLVIGYPANRNVFYELYPVTAGGGIVTIGDLIVRSADSTTFGKAVTFTNASATTPVTVGVRLTSFNPGYVSPAKVKDFITAKCHGQASQANSASEGIETEFGRMLGTVHRA